MLTILIPTDFSAASVNMAEEAVKFLNREVAVVLFHAYSMPDSHQDLLRNEPPYGATLTDGFRHACRQLKEKYPKRVAKIQFKFLQGNSSAVFRNFAEANNIDLIVCPENWVYRKVGENSLNPLPFFKKSGLPILQKLTPVRTPVVEKILAGKGLSLASA